MTSQLDDIALGALCAALQSALATLAEEKGSFTQVTWSHHMRTRENHGRRLVESGAFLAAAMGLHGGRLSAMAIDVAALAMMPGGVRIDEFVFCAKHCPDGCDARFRLSCPRCSPDDHLVGEGRDVISMEGNL